MKYILLKIKRMNRRHLHQIIICFLFFTVHILQVQSQIQNNYTNKLIELGSNDSFFEIWKLHNDSAAYFEPNMRFYAQMCIGNAFNRPELLIKSIDSLYIYYASEDYPSQYKYLKAKALFELGKYNELAIYCRSFEKDSLSQTGPEFAWIESVARQLDGTPDSRIDFNEKICTIPTPQNFPLRIPVQINNIEIPNVIIDTGAPFTFLSYATAEKCNVRMLGDTVIVGSYFGDIKAVTGIIDKMQVGNIVYHNINVKVASPQAPDYFSQSNTLGMQELARLSSIEFSPGKVTFRKNTQKKALQPNVCFRDGHPYIQHLNNNKKEEYMFDTGYDSNLIYTNDSIQENSLEWHSILENPVQFLTRQGHNDIAGTCEGLLGFPYTSSFESCILDLDQMTFSGKGYRTHPLHYSICINNGDFIRLDANRKWFEATTDEKGRWIICMFLEFLKERSEICIQYTDSLLTKYNKQLDQEGSKTTILNIRAAAFAAIGDYTSAIKVTKSFIETAPDLKGGLNKCIALEPIGKLKINWHSPESIFPATLNDNGLCVNAKINKTTSEVYFSPDKKECQISSKDATKYQMKMIEFEDDSMKNRKIAIAEELILGNMTACNVQFFINDEVDNICLGNNLLRLIPQYSMGTNQITLSSQTINSDKKGIEYPLLNIQNILCYYRPTNNDVESFAIGNTLPGMQTITLKELLEQNKKVIINIRDMHIQLK